MYMCVCVWLCDCRLWSCQLASYARTRSQWSTGSKEVRRCHVTRWPYPTHRQQDDVLWAVLLHARWHGHHQHRCAIHIYIHVQVTSSLATQVNYTVSQKNRTPDTFSNNSNNPGSISTNFGTKNRQLIALNSNCYFVINIKNRVPAEVFQWHLQQRQLHGNTPTKQRQSRNFKSLNITTSTKFETVD